jgi:hypothetical protein
MKNVSDLKEFSLRNTGPSKGGCFYTFNGNLCWNSDKSWNLNYPLTGVYENFGTPSYFSPIGFGENFNGESIYCLNMFSDSFKAKICCDMNFRTGLYLIVIIFEGAIKVELSIEPPQSKSLLSQ